MNIKLQINQENTAKIKLMLKNIVPQNQIMIKFARIIKIFKFNLLIKRNW